MYDISNEMRGGHMELTNMDMLMGYSPVIIISTTWAVIVVSTVL